MGKIKTWYRSVPLWLAVFLFAAGALVVCAFLSNKVTDAASRELSRINFKYMQLDFDAEPSDDILFYPVAGAEAGSIVVYRVNFEAMSPSDAFWYDFSRAVTRYAPLFIYAAGLLSAVLLFYFSKLKKPLTLLRNASAKIAENQLDFSLEYAGHDEMAKLCGAFEKMRSALDENNLRMLRMLDEQHQLNDAYTHDLRTPIAVLKGYTEMLAKYLPTGQLPQGEVVETVQTMSAQVARLERFVGSMNTAQRIADITIRRQRIPAGDFVCGLRETARILCGDRGLCWAVNASIQSDFLTVDPGVVTQVFENLLGNALRFAASRVTVTLEVDGPMLRLQVADDGRGFSGRELLTATKPYSGGQRDAGSCHFGLGLHICRTLCEKHGGSLHLANSGGAVVTATFGMEG